MKKASFLKQKEGQMPENVYKTLQFDNYKTYPKNVQQYLGNYY